MDIALMGSGRAVTMAEYPQREYIVRETEYPLGCTKEKEVCELVRCKDCKHNPKLEWFGCPMASLSEKQHPETAWCWKGERKGDDNG